MEANLDHHGIVASICKDLAIATKIDKRLCADASRKISSEIGTLAMIINVLG